jgi:hypothetical protein
MSAMACGKHMVRLGGPRAADRVVMNRILHATGTVCGTAEEPVVAARREASFGATAAPRISSPVRGRSVAGRGEQLTAERCAGLLFEEHVRFRAGPCVPRADAVPGGPADALQRLPHLSPQVSAAVRHPGTDLPGKNRHLPE